MKRTLLLSTFAALASAAFSQTTVTTDPVGFVTVTVPAQSDAVLAVPLQRTSVFQGSITAINGTQVTLNATPTLTAGVTYALILASGTKEGLVGKITNQSGATVTLELDSGDDLAGVAAGTNGELVNIMPYWTPGSLFATTPAVGTQILGYDSGNAGTNLSAGQIYASTGSSWEDEISAQDVTAAPLRFGSAFVLRNNSNDPITVTMVGSVPMVSHRIRLATLAPNTPQDIRFGYMCPVPEALTSLGIPASNGDTIYGFDNSLPGKNKSASTIYVYDGFSSQWVDDLTGLPLDANTKLQPGFGYTYRKVQTSTPQSVVWQHKQSYLQ